MAMYSFMAGTLVGPINDWERVLRAPVLPLGLCRPILCSPSDIGCAAALFRRAREAVAAAEEIDALYQGRPERAFRVTHVMFRMVEERKPGERGLWEADSDETFEFVAGGRVRESISGVEFDAVFFVAEEHP